MATEPITDAEYIAANIDHLERLFAVPTPSLITALRAARAENAKLREVLEAAEVWHTPGPHNCRFCDVIAAARKLITDG